MPNKHRSTRYRPRSEAERARRREEVAQAGGWYLWHRHQREEHERQSQKAETPRDERITEYPRRGYATVAPIKDKEI